MGGDEAHRRLAIAGIVMTAVALAVVAIWPPSGLTPVSFLGTIGLGAGLALCVVASFEFVAGVVVTDPEPEDDGFIWADDDDYDG